MAYSDMCQAQQVAVQRTTFMQPCHSVAADC